MLSGLAALERKHNFFKAAKTLLAFDTRLVEHLYIG